MDTCAFRSLPRVVYALPTVQGTCSTRNCRLLYHGYNAVTDDSWRKCRLLDHGYNAVSMTLGPAAMLCPGFRTGSWQKRSQRSKKVKYFGSIHTLRPPPDEGGDMCKVWLRSVQKCDLYKVQNDRNKQTNKQKRAKNHFIFIHKMINLTTSLVTQIVGLKLPNMLCPGFCTGSWQKRSQRSKKVKYCGPIIPYDLLQTKGETCAKFDWDRFRNVDLYKVQKRIETNKQTKTSKKPFHLYIQV